MYNNSLINQYLGKLKSKVPEVKMTNYNPTDINNKFTNKVNDIIQNEIYSKYVDNNIENALDVNQYIDKLESKVIDMEKKLQNMGLNSAQDKYYTKIKSLNNGMELGLIKTPNTIITDNKTGSNVSAYMVSLNDGCLSVGANDYGVYRCNDRNNKQYFKMMHILNPTSYAANIDTSYPINTNNDFNKLNYPFIMMKSINNDNCLTNNHGNLTVQPCYTFEAQRWFPLE
jgi:hypothetical protein